MSQAALSILEVISHFWDKCGSLKIPSTIIPFGLLWLTIIAVPLLYKFGTSIFDGSVGPGKSTDKGSKKQ